MRIKQRFTRLFLVILFLFSFPVRESWSDSVSKSRFYDTYRRLGAEKELDWRIRQNKSEILRLEYEANRQRFNSNNLDDYPDYLNKSERHFMNLLIKQEEALSAPYLSNKAIRDISDGFRSQASEVTAYYDEKRIEYHDYLTQLYQSRKSSPTPFFGFVVGGIVTCLTGGTAAPILLGLQVAKFGVDGMMETAYGPGSESQRVFDFFYGFGTAGFGAIQGFENVTKLWDSGQKFAGAVQYVQITNDLLQPLTNELARENPDSFIGRGIPGIMAGLGLYSNIANTSNVPEGRYPSKSSWKYPESVFRIGSAINDTVTIDYAILGKDSWAATHPDGSFYLQQGCRLTDAAQTVIATHLGTKEFNKAAELKLVQGYVAANKIGVKPAFKRVGNNEVITESLTCQEVESCYINSPRKVSPEILQNPYQFAKLRYERAGKFLQEYVSQARMDNPIAAVANPFLFTCEGTSSYSNYEDFSSYLNSISLNNKNETGNYKQNNSSSLNNLYAEASTNYIFPGGKFSVSVTNEGITYKDYLNTGMGSELTVGKFWEYRSGTVWTEKEFELGRPGHSESFSLEWEDKFANADPKAFNLIEGLKVAGSDGEIWEVDMIGGPRNTDGTFYNGKSQGFWSGGLDRHGQILPTGSGLLVDTKHQNYYAQLSKKFAPERLDWTSNFTCDWQGNYLFNQLNQPSRNFFKDFGSPFLEDFTSQTIAQKYDPWLQNYTLYGGGVEQLQDASGTAVTYNRSDSPIEMLPVLGARRSIGAEEFWRVEPGRATIGNLRTGEVKEYNLSGEGRELALRKEPTPVEVYTGEWRSKEREEVFEGNQFEAREGFRLSVVNMDRHLNTGMGNLVKGLQDRDQNWIKQSQDSFGKLGNDRNEAITQAKTEWKVLDISEVVIGTREHPRIDLSFYRDSEGKVIGYSYLPHEKELQDSHDLIDKKRDLLPRQGEIDRLQEGSKGYGRIIDKKGKDLLSFVCGLGQTKAMENVLEGSQRIYSRLVDLRRVEPDIVLPSSEFTHNRSELIGETVKFIAKENKLSLFSLASGILSETDRGVSYNIKIVTSKDKYELADYPIKMGYQWEIAKSFESNPKAPGKFTLKIDPIEKQVTQSLGGKNLKCGLGAGFPSASFSSPQGHFVNLSLDTTLGHGQSKKIEFLEGTFMEITQLNTYRLSEKFICDVALAYLLVHGITVPYTVPARIPISASLISSYPLISLPENLEGE